MKTSLRPYVGFDTFFDEVLKDLSSSKKIQSYPPYNLIRTDDHTYHIEVAVAGFSIDDLDVSVENSTLTIKTLPIDNPATEDSPQYIHRGLSRRGFKLAFVIDQFVEVISATLINGILTVSLEKKVPEEMKKKTFAISSK